MISPSTLNNTTIILKTCTAFPILPGVYHGIELMVDQNEDQVQWNGCYELETI